MSLFEKIYRSFVFLAIFAIGGSYFFIQLITQLLEKDFRVQELILSVGWLSLFIIYIVDRFKYVLFQNHRNTYILTIYLALILLAIYNAKYLHQ